MVPNANFKIGGRMYAMVTHAAACIPPESVKKSTDKPSRKLKKINNVLLLLMGKSAINKMYGYGLINPKKLIWFKTRP
jgi:hypothetical protein